MILDLLLLTTTLHSMPKNTDIQTHSADVPLADEIEQSSVIAKREIRIMEKMKKNRQTLQYLGLGPS